MNLDPRRRETARPALKSGFTLIELLVVMGIIALLLTLSVPRYFASIDKARETILADNLRSTRNTIDQYYSDTGRYPDTLQTLVDKHYLKSLPYDPVTESDSTWIITPPDDGTGDGVYQVKSGATGHDHLGRLYSAY